MRTRRQLRKFVKSFRRAILNGGPSTLMCFAVCAPLQTLLSLSGVETELVEVDFGDMNHVWLRCADGTIIDPTADQFGLDPVYIGPVPPSYTSMMQRAQRVAEFAEILPSERSTSDWPRVHV